MAMGPLHSGESALQTAAESVTLSGLAEEISAIQDGHHFRKFLHQFAAKAVRAVSSRPFGETGSGALVQL